ncbi:DegT/DnrJ/EryC1/StrS family aminotransferase [Candidatus Kapaibacterium sp.]
MNEQKNIFVTQPYLPPLDEFYPFLEKIWGNKWLTNNGEYHKEFEKALCEYLGVNHISLFANGTLAIITALQAMRITGEVITTPFSFVATTHSLWWNGIKPVFVDIDPVSYNIDPNKIEAAITPKTTAILPVHVYGKPCNTEKIQEIADIYGLKVIYDACHAFGVEKNGQSILNFGNMSILSFHATKVFTTFEGGAIVCNDESTKKRIDFLKNFGFADETTVVAPGINAKMNEFQAAFGLLQLNHIDKAIRMRQDVAEIYNEKLKNCVGVTLPAEVPGLRHTYPYYPILVNKEKFGLSRNQLFEKLKESNVFTRRYFYPLISQFPAYRGLESSKPDNLPVATSIAEEVLCLPMYPNLSVDEINLICNLITNN